MEELSIPSWVTKLKKIYEQDPIKWMWIAFTSLVAIVIISMLVFIVGKQRREASEIFADGLFALSNGDYPTAVQIFDKVRSSYRLSGLKNDAIFFSASARFGLERYNEAEDLYRQYLNTNPEPDFAAKAELDIGACREMSGDTAGALQTYKKARSKYSNSFLSKAFDVKIARLSYSVGDLKTAQEIYSRLETDTEGLWKEIARGNRRLVFIEAPKDSVSISNNSR
ncbi:MAG: hypothetical protein AUJ18_06640 [Candidatus Hydrogenedentes bacterium CG1_02_42_14]|nr:MAG: hypothetical protein AUJ18_06640 [Candidatus Hydrogenedentes bacterium CG1_02_42_14]